MPSTVDANGVVVAAYEHGQNAMFIDTQIEWDASAVANVVVLTGTNSALTVPVSVTVADMDPLSPTYRYGPFGERVRVVNSEVVTNVAQATDAANAELQRSLAATRRVVLQTVPDPAVGLRDLVTVTYPALGLVSTLAVIERVELPLNADAPMSLTVRRVFAGDAVTVAQ